MGKKRVALFGCGIFGQKHYHELSKREEVEVAAIIDRSPDKRKQLLQSQDRVQAKPLEFATLDDFLRADLAHDAGIVVTPHYAHFGIAHALLSSGKHAYVEKPFTTAASEAMALVNLAERNDLILMVGATRNVLPTYKAAAMAFQKGLIGKAEAFFFYTRFSWEQNTKATSWRQDPLDPTAGMLADHGPHFNHYLFNELKFIPQCARYLGHIPGESGVDIGAAYRLTDAEGRTALIVMDGSIKESEQRERIMIYGTYGTLAIKFDNGREAVSLFKNGNHEVALDISAALAERERLGIYDPGSKPALIHNFVSQLAGITAVNACPGSAGILPVQITQLLGLSRQFGEEARAKALVPFAYHPAIANDAAFLNDSRLSPYSTQGIDVPVPKLSGK